MGEKFCKRRVRNFRLRRPISIHHPHKTMNLNKLIVLTCAGYNAIVKAASGLQSPLLLVIRLYWGWEFFLSGKGKLADLSGPTQFFTELGIPFPAFNAALAGTTECVGGLFLLLGFASRLTTIPLIITMLVAYVT